DQQRGNFDGALRALRLGDLAQHREAVNLDHDALDGDGPTVEIDHVPGEAKGFAAPGAGDQQGHDKATGLGIAVGGGQQPADLIPGEGAYRALADGWSGCVARRVFLDQLPLARLLKGRVQDPVYVQHRARIERTRGLRLAPLALAGDAAALQ